MDLFRIACLLSILTQYEIQNINNHLKSNFSKGFDGVSPEIVKEVIEAIAQPLATAFNISLANGFFSG